MTDKDTSDNNNRRLHVRRRWRLHGETSATQPSAEPAGVAEIYWVGTIPIHPHVTFRVDPGITAAQLRDVLLALADYYRDSGGVGFLANFAIGERFDV